MANPQNNSQFNSQSDQAALALRQSMIGRGVAIPESGAVEVGTDGKPAPMPPPEGSYAAMAAERVAQQQQALGDQPLAGTLEQQVDGSIAPPPPLVPEPQQTAVEPAHSERAENRIRDLVAQLREKDRENQHLHSQAQATGESVAEMQSRLTGMQQQYEQLVAQNLDNLDPETRQQVEQDARMTEMFARFEQSMMQRIMPHIDGVKQQTVHTEMMKLGETFPRFDIQIHGPLVDTYRGKNPNSSVMQAFKAIAEPEELVTRSAYPANAVPPITPPGNSAPRVKYEPEPETASDPAADLAALTASATKLRASENPSEQKEGLRLMDQIISIKAFGPTPES